MSEAVLSNQASSRVDEVDPELERRITELDEANEMPPPLQLRDWLWVMFACFVLPIAMLLVAYPL